MIPEFDADGSLPPGIYWTTWSEFSHRYGITKHRQRLLQGLQMALDSLKATGCRTIYIGGSFITAKKKPGDFDVCWDIEGVDLNLLKVTDPVLLKFDNMRAEQKTKYGGELFPNVLPGSSTQTFLEFFQLDKETGICKGIIALDLRG